MNILAGLRLIFGKKRHHRGYSDLTNDNLLDGWRDHDNDPNGNIWENLSWFRRKSRDLAETNPYATAYLGLRVANVIGPTGIQLQSQVKAPTGEKDEAAATKIEAAWADWKLPQNCTLAGDCHHNDEDRMQERGLATDGEVMMRVYPGDRNKHRFSVRSFEPDYVDHCLNVSEMRGSNNRVIMGKEIDPSGRCVAFWVAGSHPGAQTMIYDGKTKTRVPALSEYMEGDRFKPVSPVGYILHHFNPQRAGQVRGFPELAPVISPLRKLERTEDAHHDQAQAAAKILWQEVSTHADLLEDQPETVNKGRLSLKNATIAQPGYGKEFKTLQPGAPNSDIPAHGKFTLKGIAAAMGINYSGLSGDLEGTSFSTTRMGLKVEQENWKIKQDSAINGRHRPLFNAWLRAQLQFNAAMWGLSPLREMDYRAARFQGPRWEYVNPAQDMAAKKIELELRLNSPQRLMHERGRDPDEIAAEWAEWDAKTAPDAGSGDASGTKTAEEKALDVALAIQKIYLGVGVVLSAEEAREIVNGAGGDLSSVLPEALINEKSALSSEPQMLQIAK